MEFRRSVIAQNEAITAGSTVTHDLPVNPMSHLIMTLRGLNVIDEATLAQILERISKVEILRFGASIFSLSGADLHKLNAILLRNMPILANQVAADNSSRWISLIIPFSRKMYDPNEGLPATTRGELKLQITFSSTETEIDNLTLQVESAEMLGATPKRYLKVTTLTQTMTSGVDNDVELPIGNQIAGLLIYSTTIPTGGVFTTTAGKMRMLIDNVEKMFAATNWESLHGEVISRLGHREAYDASADNDDVANYALMDFSPNGTDDFIVETKGKSSLVLKITAGDANAVRVLPVELVTM